MAKNDIPAGRRTPRYIEVAERIASDIQSGEYPVGSRMPTETAMTQDFGISRYTARAALRKLQDWKMIETVQGIGSKVVAIKPMQSGVRFSFDSLNNFLVIAEETKLISVNKETKPVGEQLSKISGWRFSDQCLHITATRVADSTDPELDETAYVEIFLHGRYKRIGKDVGERQYAIATQIEEEFGVKIGEVTQTIAPALITNPAATALGVEVDTLGLIIQRVYRSDNNDVPFVVISHQAGLNAVVTMRMHYQ